MTLKPLLLVVPVFLTGCAGPVFNIAGLRIPGKDLCASSPRNEPCKYRTGEHVWFKNPFRLGVDSAGKPDYGEYLGQIVVDSDFSRDPRTCSYVVPTLRFPIQSPQHIRDVDALRTESRSRALAGSADIAKAVEALNVSPAEKARLTGVVRAAWNNTVDTEIDLSAKIHVVELAPSVVNALNTEALGEGADSTALKCRWMLTGDRRRHLVRRLTVVRIESSQDSSYITTKALGRVTAALLAEGVDSAGIAGVSADLRRRIVTTVTGSMKPGEYVVAASLWRPSDVR